MLFSAIGERRKEQMYEPFSLKPEHLALMKAVLFQRAFNSRQLFSVHLSLIVFHGHSICPGSVSASCLMRCQVPVPAYNLLTPLVIHSRSMVPSKKVHRFQSCFPKGLTRMYRQFCTADRAFCPVQTHVVNTRLRGGILRKQRTSSRKTGKAGSRSSTGNFR